MDSAGVSGVNFSESGSADQSRLGRQHPGYRHLMAVVTVAALVVEIVQKTVAVKQLAQSRQQATGQVDTSFGAAPLTKKMA